MAYDHFTRNTKILNKQRQEQSTRKIVTNM